MSPISRSARSDDERWPAWIARQLAPATIDDSGCDGLVASAGYQTLDKTANQLWNDHHSVTNNYYLRMLPVAEVECMTLVRQIYSQRQLFEVMVDFWHDHFSVFGWDYDGGPMFVAMDRDAIRPYALGNFRTMLQAVGESASMMYMLDLYASQSGHPNENYARELMELHTLGAENYAGIIVNPDSPANLDAARHVHRVGRRDRAPQVRRRRRLRSGARADRLDDLGQRLAVRRRSTASRSARSRTTTRTTTRAPSTS